ncbi:hypothetical protein PG1C_03930 [Rugosibacter aromaticivorans]|uniref:Uncharacterized protein n=1 Tax=Rugosibacter aromaticivorans TaxID=1565605 RepID=A0A0C5IYM3_9PROT|nr:hypothetical protein PG1C_03930 [Rugosibacter aromaticivorans]
MRALLIISSSPILHLRLILIQQSCLVKSLLISQVALNNSARMYFDHLIFNIICNPRFELKFNKTSHFHWTDDRSVSHQMRHYYLSLNMRLLTND